MKTAILKASVEFIEQPFLKPMQISSGLIGQATEARVTVSVSTGKKEGVGRGSIYLSDLWAWPGGALDRRAKDAAMRGLCRELASSLARHCGSEEMHPLELGLRLHHAANGLLPEMPPLAKSVCMSPFDAAIHDAAGIALGKSAFSFYAGNEVIPSADSLFPGTGAVRAIRQTVRSPVRTLDAWWIVGANDNLENDVRPAVAKRGIRCFKLKALGRDNLADAARTAEVYRAARGWGLSPVLSIDTNEGSPDVAAVWDYLARLEAMDPEAYAAVAYLEQPTSRDLVGSPQDWRALGGRKPVLLDEG
ncbi:MAG: hypothetical protein WCQ57_15000, partial [Verrucomicrobiota bacterium]